MSKCEIEMNTAKEKERLFKIFRANAQRSVIGVAIEEDDFNYLADAIIEEYANKQMKELLEWLEEYRLNTMSLMGIGDYEQGQIDVLTDVINRVDPNRCSYCGKDGFHNMSCPNNKERQKRLLVDIMQADENDRLYNKAIPTLEGDEAEEFIRKADENVKAMRQRRCKNHVWRKDFLNGGKKCQVCNEPKKEPTRNKEVEP